MHRRVALIAYSLRFPGTDTQHFWQDLLAKKDLVTEVDPTRWSKDSFLHPDKRHPGSSYTFAAGSLGDVSGFDAAFFGISPREAALMDPQQRLLLELAWETFENAGIVPSTMRGSECGVYVGISNVDYAYRVADDLEAIDSFAATGIISSIASNRISYVFDLHGPSLSLDTACSSSLVAFHQACAAIRSGEITQALAGGINLHLHPYVFISFSKATMLSKTGRCHVFDESSDGYVRSEGGGLFLLKDLAQAIADGDQILAEVAGTAINTDGHKSGLTIPNPIAQAALMRRVYEQAGIAPDAIDYFEAHGTGTPVGDPIETQAIGMALGQQRKVPLLIGSVKSNLGHLESASGVAGLVKALHCIEHRMIPATLSSTQQINPNINCADWNIRIVTENQPLKASGELTIGINSFGFGGANAHVILQSHCPTADTTRLASAPRHKLPLRLSAKDASALKQSALALADFLEEQTNDSVSFYDIAHSAFFRREHHAHTAVVFSDNRIEAVQQLRCLAHADNLQQKSAIAPEVYSGNRLPQPGAIGFVFSGNGCQWHTMGQHLLEQSAVFKQAIIEIDELFSAYADFSLVDELSGVNGNRYADTQIAQPALFALQVGITNMLRAQGIQATAVVGHSVGEVAAAWAAGILPLAEAVKVIFYRSYHQGKTQGSGGMSAVALGVEDIMPLLDSFTPEQLCLAGINSSRGTTCAGAVAQLAILESQLAANNVFHKRLDLDYAFHSPAMDTIKAGVLTDLANLNQNSPTRGFFSTVTGELIKTPILDANYWWLNIRQPVQFQQAVDALLASGVNTLIEIGAHPVLQSYLNDGIKAADQQGIVISTLTRNNGALAQIQNSVAQTLLSGAPFDYRHWFPVDGRFVKLPNYAWQREKHWHTVTAESHGLLERVKVHPLLGYALKQHQGIWENQLDIVIQTHLADHNVGGAIVFPGAGFAELALAAAYQAQPTDFIEIEELEIRSPLLLNPEHSKVIRCVLSATDGRLTIQSRELAKSSDWLLHAVGRVLIEATGRLLDIPFPKIPQRDADFDSVSHQHVTETVGLGYGDAFQAIDYGWVEGNRALGVLRLPDCISAGLAHYFLHPAFLDCAFQLVFQILKDSIEPHEGLAFVPVKMGKLYVRTDKAIPAYAQAVLLHRAPHSLNTEFVIFDAQGLAIALVKDVRFRAVRLQRAHVPHLHFLEYHLTAAPLVMEAFETAAFAKPKNLPLSMIASARRYSEEVEPLLDSLSDQFIVEALRRLADEQGFLSAAKLNQYSGEASKTGELLRILMTHCETRAYVLPTVSPVGWRVKAVASDDISAMTIWNILIQEYPDYFYLFHCVGRWGLKLNALLKAEVHPDATGLTTAHYALISSFVLEQTLKKHLTEILISQCLHLEQQLASGKRLRILEINADKPQFAGLLCSHLDLHRTDYLYGSYSEEAVTAAKGLREHFPLLQTLLLSEEMLCRQAQANVAIVNLATVDISHLKQLLNMLPTVLQPGCRVFFVGLQPAQWLGYLLGIHSDWWVRDEHQVLPQSPQLSVHALIEQLQTLAFTDIEPLTEISAEASGIYVVMATPNTARAVQRESAAALMKAQTSSWLVLSDNDESATPLARQLVEGLRVRGADVSWQPWQADRSVQHCLDATQTSTGVPLHIIHLVGFGQSDAKVQTRRCTFAAELLQAAEATATDATVWLLTQNVGTLWACDQQQAFSTPATIAQDAALWGFGRSLMNESTHCRVQLLDIAAECFSTPVLEAVLLTLLNGDAEQEIVLNNEGQRFVPRLRSRESLTDRQSTTDTMSNQHWQLGFKLPGQLRNLQWMPIVAKTLADDELEIDVKATGLNFRDVMYTLGLLSDEAVENGFVGSSLGLEFAGKVIRVGRTVRDFNVGDDVVGLGPASFSQRVLTQANAVALIPNNLSFAAAATIPSTFFTVYYALHHQARLQAGEKVLIHGAAGGVGIAAIQVARWLGAEIYATVGSEEKRDFLLLLGVTHCYDSRSLTFAEDILAQTNQEGVDVVLNSLAGEAINRNFQVLKPFGRFLELGKRDFYENTPIGLRPFRNNISYFGIDADQLMRVRPELTQRLYQEMMQLFHEGILQPLPYTVFDANQVIEAFRYMQQAKQIGKIVVTYENSIHAKPVVEAVEKPCLQLSADASYLVTGGLGGFGLRTAQWLVSKGAKHLILIGRSGVVSEEARLALAEFKTQGVIVQASACDVTDKAALSALLTACEKTLPPLKGIIHAAAVIEDSLVRNMTAAQLAKVLAPKIQGALVLHELSLDKSLDLFVLYSSVTTLFGNPGQANYVAANLWLEALSAYRRQHGLVATCICWGAIDDVGYLTRNKKIKDALQSRMGGAALSAATALDVLEQRLLSESHDHFSSVGVMEFDWRALNSFLPTARTPKFHELAMQMPHTEHAEDNRADIQRMLGELSDSELQLTFIDWLKEELSQILLVNKDKIDADLSMYDMGLDSLMGVELMTAIEARFDVQIPVMALSEAPTLNKLAARLLAQLRGDHNEPSESTATLANIEDLSKRHGSVLTAEQKSSLAKALEADSSGRIIH